MASLGHNELTPIGVNTKPRAICADLPPHHVLLYFRQLILSQPMVRPEAATPPRCGDLIGGEGQRLLTHPPTLNNLGSRFLGNLEQGPCQQTIFTRKNCFVVVRLQAFTVTNIYTFHCSARSTTVDYSCRVVREILLLYINWILSEGKAKY